MRRTVFFLGFIFISLAGICQLQVRRTPLSTQFGIKEVTPAESIRVPAPDLNALQKEDAVYPTPYRFAVLEPVDVDAARSGSWQDVPGGRIWRTVVSAPGAKALSAYFDKISFREGEMMFLYLSLIHI